MEIGQIETFIAVATFGGFHRAAEALHMSQPAVSARIKALEQSLGVTLFTRGQGALVLSQAGRALKPHAEQLLRQAALARQSIHELQPGGLGALRIAAALSVCTYLLPDVLSRFHDEHPNVMVTIRSGTSSSNEVLEMVMSGDAEIGLARSLYHPEIEKVSLRADPLVLVGESSLWSRAARPGHLKAHLEQVAEWPLIFFDRGSTDWTLTHAIFRRAGLVPNVVLEVEVIETAKKMVERGLGLAFLPHLAVAREIEKGTLVCIEIADAEPVRRTLDVIYSRHRPLRAEAQAFLSVVKSALSEAVSQGKTEKKPSHNSARLD